MVHFVDLFCELQRNVQIKDVPFVIFDSQNSPFVPVMANDAATQKDGN